MNDIAMDAAQLLGSLHRYLEQRPVLVLMRLGLVVLVAIALPVMIIAAGVGTAVRLAAMRGLFWAAYLVYRTAPGGGPIAVNHSSEAGDNS